MPVSASLPRQRLAMAAVLSAMGLAVLDAGLVNVALPTIGHSLEETPSRTLLIVGTYQLALLVGLLPCAHLADRLGHRQLFVAGVVLYGCSAILSASAPTLPLLVVARALQGLGGAAIMALGIALLRVALGPERLGTAIAWNALVVAICSAAAPAAAAILLSFAGWRWLFLVPLPLAAIALGAAPALPAVRPTERSTDVVGISLYAAAAGSLFVAAQLVRIAWPAAVAAAVGAVLLGTWLVARERAKAAPLLPLDLLELRPFRRSVMASAFFFIGQSAGLLALPFYLQLSLGRSAATVALVLACWPVAVSLTSRIAHRLADRFAAANLCPAGGIILAIGLAATAVWPIGSSVAPLMGCALVCGIGFGLFQVPNNRIMFLSAPANRSAAAGGLQGTARLAGQTAGALLVALVLSAFPISTAPQVAMGLAAAAALSAAWVSRAPSGNPATEEHAPAPVAAG